MERVKYQRPKEESAQYEYTAKDAVRDQEQGRREQEVARKAGKIAVSEIDEILDSIDEILEENAETFVAQFIQANGE